MSEHGRNKTVNVVVMSVVAGRCLGENRMNAVKVVRSRLLVNRFRIWASNS